MRVWIVSVGLLFLGAQLYDWLVQLTIPLWLYGLVGLGLAIASNRSASLRSAIATPSKPESTKTE